MMIKELYNKWLEGTKNDSELYEELIAIKDKESEIEDRFYKDLEFGTGGQRGIIGAGTNRMNLHTVARTNQGVANFINSTTKNGSVVIAYDSRNKSEFFAMQSAKVLAANGIKVYLFSRLMPTPILSFAVRQLKTTMGIVITASHNPKMYNGYKVYGSDGCQLTDNAANEITRYILQIEDYFNISRADENSPLIEILDDTVYEQFLDAIEKLSLYPDNAKYSPKIVYTPLNGTGNKPVRDILKRIGINDLIIVPEQENPDPNFTTCSYPNPEEKAALSLAIKLAGEKGADLVFATDPDADRIGIAVREQNGEYRLFNGNETGVMLLYYILTRRKALGTLTDNAIAIKTIVSTDMCFAIAKDFGVKIIEVLTGFKYIGEQMTALENKDDYVFGFEESYGYLCGTHARDKDAVSAAMMICEMTAFYKSQGKTLIDVLNFLYAKYGYNLSTMKSIEFLGKSGKEKMNSIIDNLKQNPLENIAGQKVIEFKDYSKGIEGLPKSAVLSFIGENFRILLRPSGTEPKLKIYFLVVAKDKATAQTLAKDMQDEMVKLTNC